MQVSLNCSEVDRSLVAEQPYFVTVDTKGEKQELQTAWNLRGVAEAGWSVSRIALS